MFKNKSKKVELSVRKILFETKDLTILQEDGIYVFDIDKVLFTKDVLEAVSYLLKYKKFEDLKFWKYALDERMTHYVVPANSLYWLSGGQHYWNKQNSEWVDSYEVYERTFQAKLYKIIENAKTLGDLRTQLVKNFNLDMFCEFSLEIKNRRELYQ